MSRANTKHIEFIRLISQGVNQSEAYKATVGKKGATTNSVKSKASNLCKRFAKEIQTEKDRIQSIITSTKDNEVIKNAMSNIVSQAEADAMAFRILKEGEQVSDVVILMGQLKVIQRKPTQQEIQRAYQNYNLRFGSNAPAKTETTITDQRPPSKVTMPDGTTIEL